MLRPNTSILAAPRSSTLLVVIVLLGLATAISSCGSSSSSGNGVSSKTPAEILAASKTAADRASSVHVAGALSSGEMPITLNLELASGHGGRGQVSEGGLSFELIVVDDSVYIKGSPSFYSHFGGAAAARLFQGKWLRAPSADGELASLASLTDFSHLLDQTLASHGALVKGATSTVAGQPVIELHDTAKSGSLYIATTGQPYPIRIVKRGTEAGSVSFTGWNQPVSLAAPAGAIDLSQLQQAGH
jgi:hypothetical protein